MDLPDLVKQTLLYKRLARDADLLQAVLHLRAKAEALAETLIRDAQAFTDHTVRHMDALWSITEKVLTPQEIERSTTAEAFLLAAGFYLHDIGMAYAATADGRNRLEQTREYQGTIAAAGSNVTEEVRGNALSTAIRAHHANAAHELATKPIAGKNDYLLEPSSVREQFGNICGVIAASHHWSIDRVDSELATQGVVPLAGNREADLAFVACALRIIDYAHINRDRAPRLGRLIRREIPPDSAVHWNAQQNVDGPLRSDNELVYSATTPIEDVDAWWLIYDFATGLDNEIRQTTRLLKKRQASQDRISLIGVRGANHPREFAKTVQTAGYLPLEVHVKASSITRLVRILAGESLYGKNFMAPVRELLQNARDAVALKKAVSTSPPDRAAASLPIEVKLVTEETPVPTLTVTDWGVGMSKDVITEHLITIASDYWESKFHIDYPNAPSTFSPTGRFGIGFLSVFMLGDQIWVQSQKTGDDSYKLSIRGLGRRAELRKVDPQTASGSTVSVNLKPDAAAALAPLGDLLKTYIPLLDVPVQISVNSNTELVPERWTLSLSTFELKQWSQRARERLSTRTSVQGEEFEYMRRWRRFRDQGELTEDIERKLWPLSAPEYRAEGIRLVADEEGSSVLCLKGFALQSISTPGFSGVINSTDITPDAARTYGLDIDIKSLLASARAATRDAVIETLSARRKQGFIPDQLDFAAWCASIWEKSALLQSDFPWVQIVEKSGDTRYISTTELKAALVGTERIFLGINLTSNAVSGRWRHRSTSNGTGEAAFCFPTTSLQYAHEPERGSLADLFDDWAKIRFLGYFMELLAEHWGLDVRQLANGPELIHSGSEIHGFVHPKANIHKT